MGQSRKSGSNTQSSGTYLAAVITVSDKGAIGERVDTSGPAIVKLLKEGGFDTVYKSIIPDDFEIIRKELLKCSDELKLNLIITTGGTGFSQKDITPEATRAVIERDTPGIPEAMRLESLKITSRAMLSRSVAGIRQKTLIINLPGSEKAARENLLAILPTLGHGMEMLLTEASSSH